VSVEFVIGDAETNDMGARYDQWLSFMVECEICGTLWAGVAPVGAVEAECPTCGHFAAIPDGWRYANEAEEAAVEALPIADRHYNRPTHYTAQTELRGRLEQVTVYGGRSEFQIYDPVTGKGTPCHFSAQDAERVGALITHRIAVVGLATYNRDDELVSVQVQECRSLREDSELPQIEDLHDLDIQISGDQSSEDFIRGLRDED